MSLIDGLLKSFLTKDSSTNSSSQGEVLITAALVMLDKAGGIQGVIEKFQASGLDDVIASWVGTGQNKSITPDQITQALGKENIQAITEKANIPTSQSGDILSQLLPVLIDSLTPNGQVPEQSQLITIGKTVITSMLASSNQGGAKSV